MARARWVRTSDGVERQLDAMVNRTKQLPAYLQRVVYPQYQKAQIARWQSENASEGNPWPALNDEYAKWKRRKFAGYDGGGNVMMIRTGDLSQSAMGRKKDGIIK